MKSSKKPGPGKPRKPTKGTYPVGFKMGVKRAKMNVKQGAALNDNDGDECSPAVKEMMKSFKSE